MKKLPVELVEKILHLANLSHNARLACRLVCRGFCSILTPIAFRRVRTSEFSRDDFDRIVNLSQSPIARFVREYEYKLTPLLSLTNVHDVDPLVQLPSDSDPVSVRGMAQVLIQHHTTHLLQFDILGTFYDIISLSKALPAFVNLKSVTISSFSDIDTAPPDLESATTRAFWAVIKALNNCPFWIESFTIDSLYAPTLTAIGDAGMGQIHEVFGNLESLSILAISMARDMSRMIQDVIDDIIYQTPNLKVLRIGKVEHRRTMRTPPICSPCLLHLSDGYRITHNPFYWPHLRILEIRLWARIPKDNLLKFLGRHKGTLRELTIIGFILMDPHTTGETSDWNSFFKDLKALLALEKFVLDGLVAPDHNGLYVSVEASQLRIWEDLVPRPIHTGRKEFPGDCVK